MELLIHTYQLWAGIWHHVLDDTQLCPWILDHWLSHLRVMMNCNQIKIKYNSWNILPTQQHDHYLMEDFMDQNFSKQKMEQLNACWMYLQVTTLAEVSDHTGMELIPQAFPTSTPSGIKSLDTISTSTLQWPNIAPTMITCWQTWSTTVQTLYMGSRNGTRLQQPLGHWLPQYEQH